MILGLTGSFGSGKSAVADMFKELGAVIIDADAIAREVAEPGGSAYKDIVDFFGEEILNPDKTLDRKKIAGIVFNDKEKLDKLNSIVHPRVREKEMALMDEYKNRPVVIFMVPLLFENGLEKSVDLVICVVVKDAIRFKRLSENRKISLQEIENRLKNQLPQEEKVLRSDFVIENSGSLENTREQVKQLYNHLLMNE